MTASDALEIKTGIQVLKNNSAVYEAIVNPDQMKNYFIGEGSGIMLEGDTVNWKFSEVDKVFSVRVGKMIYGKYVSFYWDGASDGENTFVEITLLPIDADTTFITVTEKSKLNNIPGIKWLKSNTEGWANFLACLKAWMEYGIHLRKGAFRNPLATQ